MPKYFNAETKNSVREEKNCCYWTLRKHINWNYFSDIHGEHTEIIQTDIHIPQAAELLCVIVVHSSFPYWPIGTTNKNTDEGKINRFHAVFQNIQRKWHIPKDNC